MGLFLDALYSATLLPHYAWHRFATGKYGSGTPEKLGHLPASLSGAGAHTLWIHAVSVGEALAARPLAKAFRAAHPDWQIRVSTTTATGREVAQKHFGAENVFYYPLDFTPVVRKVFDLIQPSLIVLMELEVWPNFLVEASRRKVPVAVSNVRITDRSFDRFMRLQSHACRMLNRISVWASMAEEYSDKLRKIGVAPGRVHTVGSLKYDGLSFDDQPDVAERLRRELGGGRLILAGSTHTGEDEIVYDAFVRLRQRFGEDIHLVLVPRHPERCDAVAAMAPEGLRVHRRSAGPVTDGAGVVLVDTMGELGDLYRAAEVVFVGGTLLERVGGHNMLEPAAVAKPVVYGSCVHNFSEPARLLVESGGAVQISSHTGEALADALGALLQDADAAQAMGQKARKAAQSMQGATARTMELLEPLVAADA